MAMLSMNEMTTFRWSFSQDVAAYCAAGIPAIGVWRRKLADFGEERGIELLAESGLEVSNLLWAGGFTGSDGRTYRESVDDAGEAVRLAAAMSAGTLVTHSGARGGHTFNHAKRLFYGALEELAPLAADLGVTLAIEPMHPECGAEWTFLASVDDALDVINELCFPNVKLVFDTYHLCQNGELIDRIAELVPHIAVVHLGDSRQPPSPDQNRTPLGSGTVPLKRIIAALAAAGYDGYYDVELMGEEIESSDYEQLLSQSKRVFDELA